MKTWTFLFTDLEGSTALYERAPETYRAALARHFELLRAEVTAHGGEVFRNSGDGLLATFEDSAAALSCGVACQKALQSEAWPGEIGALRVRIGLHRGAAERGVGDFHGLTMHHATRVLDAAHGGQVICSAAVWDHSGEPLAGVVAGDLGLYRLRGVPTPMRLFQVQSAGDPGPSFPPLRAAPAFTHTLPARPTRFFGRDAELHELKVLLAPELPSPQPRRHGRLVTLLGPGGTGKTRLSLAVGESLLNAYSHAVWFAALAEIRDAQLIPDVLLGALGLAAETGRPALEQVIEFLGAQPLLLILDNFEQLVPAGVETVRVLLERVPRLVCLVSSRVRLELHAEQEFSLAPLRLPPASGSPEELLRHASVQLFCDRAQAARRDFRLYEKNAGAVAQVCRVLEGIPLAIELAAARTTFLTPRQVLAKLGNRLDFLVGRKQDFADRHRTLRATVAWSFELLVPPLQRLFARLSIFRGGWTIESAEAVVSCPPDAVLEGLCELQSCSLIIAEEQDGEMRYRMLEVIREFSAERLKESGEQAATAERHAAFFVQLAGDESGLDEATQLRRLAAEQDNLRAILASAADPLLRVNLAIDLHSFWLRRGHFREGREWLRRLEADAAAVGRTAGLANAAGVLAWKCGDLHEARGEFETALAVAERQGNESHVAGLLNNLGVLADDLGEFEAARGCYDRSLAVYRRLDWSSEIATVLSNLGRSHLESRQPEVARPALLESLRMHRELEQHFYCANTLHNLADMAAQQGDFPQARAYLAECLRLRAELGTDHDEGLAFLTLAAIAIDEGMPALGARLLSGAEAAFERLESPAGPVAAARMRREFDRVRPVLGAEEFATCRRAGAHLQLHRVLTADGAWRSDLDQSAPMPNTLSS